MASDDELRRFAEDARALARSLGRDARSALRDAARDGRIKPETLRGAAERARSHLQAGWHGSEAPGPWAPPDPRRAGTSRPGPRPGPPGPGGEPGAGAQGGSGQPACPGRPGWGQGPRPAPGPWWNAWGCQPRSRWAPPGPGAWRATPPPPASPHRGRRGLRRRPAPPLRHRRDEVALVAALGFGAAVLWVLGLSGAIHVAFEAVLAVGLMVLGAVTMVTARTDWSLSRRRWPIIAGLATIVLLFAASAPVHGPL